MVVRISVQTEEIKHTTERDNVTYLNEQIEDVKETTGGNTCMGDKGHM